MASVVLHYYDFSNHSEKIRIAIGQKTIAWRSVVVPPVLPKPGLVALTGRYRRTPVLQIGPAACCDTRKAWADDAPWHIFRPHLDPTRDRVWSKCV